ncbi:hypothetical protein D8I30_13860 [Brevundimonas naejangsanensis]|uniref:DUF2927 domain-containing protein n=2 Tax=Brevundimonas naejangsanensis TaxID=588932 RepID=A0A494RI98_9CAUL|nr:hypothetical protein D8I30_13860 [Brevundimonas naejangsanensis]
MLAWATALLMAGTISGAAPQEGPPSATMEDTPVRLGDVVVSGRSLRDEVQTFVDEVAAPPPGRGLARWNDDVCIGTVNIGQEIAQPLIDHIAGVASTYGLRIREPGCRPNVIILFADDGAGLASALVTARPQAFRVRWSSQLDRGSQALDAFESSGQPIRWWHVSLPVVGLTGARAIRMPGDIDPIYVPGGGRMNKGRAIADNLIKVIIIVDLAKVEGVLLPELGDYLALVALAQIDPDGDTSRHDTVLNLFSRPGSVRGLSGWDKAYLASLYDAYPERINPSDHAASITRDIRRAEREAASESEAAH